jgi:hypothetical protein
VSNKPRGPQFPTIAQPLNVPQLSFDLDVQDKFITSYGVELEHWAAIPSPLGKREKGDYRRGENLDTITSNGFLYRKKGCFTAVFLSNSKNKGPMDGGIIDMSTARLTLPRFYNKNGLADGERIYLAPGDKVYVANKNIDTHVIDEQEMEYEPNRDNMSQFPVCKVEFLIDSNNIEYFQDVDFKVTQEGNIRWIGKNPGIDPNTGKGRVYSMRYVYNAHWYITMLLNEVRIGQVTVQGERKEQRMPYHCQIMREYMFHNRNNSSTQPTEKPKKEDKSRTNEEPREAFKPSPFIKVNMSDVEDTEE